MEETATIKLTEADTQLLKKIVGERICYFFTDRLKVEATGDKVLYWAPEFALGLKTNRGDLIAIRTAGAYGEVMASGYNLRNKVKAVYI